MRVVLCGSQRFRDLYIDWTNRLTRAGHQVHAMTGAESTTRDQHAIQGLVQLKNIAEGDALFVLDGPVDGSPYIGQDAAREIAWAQMWGKTVFWFSNGAGARLLENPAAVMPVHGDALHEAAGERYRAAEALHIDIGPGGPPIEEPLAPLTTITITAQAQPEPPTERILSEGEANAAGAAMMADQLQVRDAVMGGGHVVDEELPPAVEP